MGERSSRSHLPAPATNDKDSPKKFEFLSVGSMVEASSDDEGFKGAWYVGKIVKTNKGKGKFVIEYQSLTCDEESNKPLREKVDISFLRPVPPPPAADQSYEVHDVVEAFHRDGWWKGIVSKVESLEGEEKSSKYTVFFDPPPEEFTFCCKDLRFHLVWADGKWSKPSKEEIPIEILHTIRKSDVNSIEEVTRSSTAMHQNEKQKSSSKRTRAEVSHSKDESSAKKSRNNLLDVEEGDKGADNVTENSISNGMGTSSSAAKSQNEKKKSSSNKTRYETFRSKDRTYVRKTRSNRLDIEEEEDNGFGKKDKGDQQNVSEGNATEMVSENCPNKETEISFSTDNAGEPQHISEVAAIKMVSEHCRPKEIETSFCAGEEGHSEDSNQSPAIAVQSDEGQVENLAPSPAAMVENEEGQVDNLNHSSAAMVEGEGHVENTNQSPAIMVQSDEGQVDNLDQSPAAMVLERDEGQAENLNQSPAIAMPFTKNLPIWEHVDSLDVFQYMPQKPHFSPLFELNEVLREGHAIGLFLNFSRLVETTSKMRADEPKKVFESNLEALADLESYGFEVKPVVDRLEKLLSIKTKLEEVQNESEDVQVKIAKRNADKKEVEEELRKINEKISKLEAQRAIKISEKLAKESERESLRLAVIEIDEQISKADLDFENLATAPW